MKEAQVSFPLLGIEPATPSVLGGSLGRSATRLTKIRDHYLVFSISRFTFLAVRGYNNHGRQLQTHLLTFFTPIYDKNFLLVRNASIHLINKACIKYWCLSIRNTKYRLFYCDFHLITPLSLILRFLGEAQEHKKRYHAKCMVETGS